MIELRDYQKQAVESLESKVENVLRNPEHGVILYVDKNTLQSKVFEIPFDEHKSAEISDKFSFLHKSLVNDSLPEAEAKAVKDMNWMCGFCEYKNKCDKSEK